MINRLKLVGYKYLGIYGGVSVLRRKDTIICVGRNNTIEFNGLVDEHFSKGCKEQLIIGGHDYVHLFTNGKQSKLTYVEYENWCYLDNDKAIVYLNITNNKVYYYDRESCEVTTCDIGEGYMSRIMKHKYRVTINVIPEFRSVVIRLSLSGGLKIACSTLHNKVLDVSNASLYKDFFEIGMTSYRYDTLEPINFIEDNNEYHSDFLVNNKLDMEYIMEIDNYG